MSRPPERVVRLSVLDRLMDATDSPAATAGESVAGMKRALLRDLEWLLNTRRVVEPAGEEYREVRRSVYHFGLPDVTSRNADSADTQLELARDIEECIRVFEPRLTAVRVIPREAVEQGSRLARFTIDALLRMDPEPERVVFDTVLDTPTGEIRIRGDADA